jgi:hypothetical protein
MTGNNLRIFRKYLSYILRKHDIQDICTAAILNTAQLVGNVVM